MPNEVPSQYTNEQDMTGGHLATAFGPGQMANNNASPLGYNGNLVPSMPVNGITLKSLTASNEGAAAVWLMLFDSTTRPSNGASNWLFIPFPFQASPSCASFVLDVRYKFVNGVYWVCSATAGTLTAATGATMNITVSY
jgi:hypothetical protein